MIDEKEIALRIVLAFITGAFLGTEREKRHKPAGIRTHALVSMGAALFTVVSAYGFTTFSGAAGYNNMDPARIAAQIVAGVGFIGAGLIFKERKNVHGLTTAATIWLTAAIGTGLGIGMYKPVITAAVLAFLALKMNSLLKYLGFDDEDEAEDDKDENK